MSCAGSYRHPGALLLHGLPLLGHHKLIEIERLDAARDLGIKDHDLDSLNSLISQRYFGLSEHRVELARSRSVKLGLPC